MSRLDQQFQFLLEMDKEKQVQRQTRCTDKSMENDAEHAWHIALCALILHEYANADIDLLKTISMLLIHDVVEIDAKDTYAYDEKGQSTAFEREDKGAKRLFSLLPEDQKDYLYKLWLEFEENKSAEAQFAHAMDNVQPVMLNHADNGFMWGKNQVHLSKILKRQENTKKGSNELYRYLLSNFIKPHIEDKIMKDCEIPND